MTRWLCLRRGLANSRLYSLEWNSSGDFDEFSKISSGLRKESVLNARAPMSFEMNLKFFPDTTIQMRPQIRKSEVVGENHVRQQA